MDFMINPLKWNNSFAVPSEVVDKHIRLAGSVQLKVLLWMMRHSAEEKNMDEMSKDLGVSVADCSDALTFWSEMGLLVATDKTFAPEKVAEKVPEPVVETKKQ